MAIRKDTEEEEVIGFEIYIKDIFVQKINTELHFLGGGGGYGHKKYGGGGGGGMFLMRLQFNRVQNT